MPTLRSRSIRTKSSTSPSVPASTSTARGSLNNIKSNPPAEASSVVTAFCIDPVTPAGVREHALSSSPAASPMRLQTRAAAGTVSERTTRQSERQRQGRGKKLLFADQQEEKQQQHEEGAAVAAEITVTRRTSQRVRRRVGGPVGRIMETKETAASVVATFHHRDPPASLPAAALRRTDEIMAIEKGKRKAVVALSESGEEDEATMAPADMDISDTDEDALISSFMDDAGGGTSSAATREGQSPQLLRRTPSFRRGDLIKPVNRRAEATKAKFLEVARRRAAHFAHFTDQEDDPASSSAAAGKDADSGRVVDEQMKRAAELLAQVSADTAHRSDHGDEQGSQWPGPFVIARQLVEGRESAAAARHESTRSSGAHPQQSSVEWFPCRQADFAKTRIPTSLHDMCVEVLCANIEHVTSLVGVTDAAKKLISARLCAQRVMTPNAFRLYFLSEPGEVTVPDCTFVTEETLTEALANCSTQKLEVLELGLCGRAMSDQLCSSTLGGLSSSLPNLHTLILNGAYRLTDIGLKTLVTGTPRLITLNLKQCNMISAVGLETVANSVGQTLKTLSLESCTQLDAIKVLAPLLKMSSLENVSLSGLCGMSDGIISELAVILGPHLRELSIADCRALTDSAIRAISLCCTGLRLLDIGHLPMLTDVAIGNLADGCRSLKTLRLDRGKFSDTTLAALITASGNRLTELSLNSVRQAGDLTVSALAKHSKGTLEQLDLSFCRAVSDQALGLLADTCEGLHEIRLFGCTQVTDVFLEGHSNPLLNVVGLPSSVIDVSCSTLKASRTVV